MTIREGTNRLLDIGADPVGVILGRYAAREAARPAKIEGWDGCAAERMTDVLKKLI